MLRAVHAMESREACEAKALEVASELEKSKLGEAARVVREGYEETLTYTRFPAAHLEEDPHQQRDRAPQPRDPSPHPRGRHLPGRQVGLMLVTARLKYVAESEWGSRRYLDVTLLDE